MFNVNNIFPVKKIGNKSFDLLGGTSRHIAVGDHITKKQRISLRQDPWGNNDRDGVINGLDCQPNNALAHQALRRRLAWHPENIRKGVVPNKPGVYRFYDSNGNLLYVGHAHRMRHRLQSYYQKDCPCTHPTKVDLRDKIASVRFTLTDVHKARKIEKSQKHAAPHNHL